MKRDGYRSRDKPSILTRVLDWRPRIDLEPYQLAVDVLTALLALGLCMTQIRTGRSSLLGKTALVATIALVALTVLVRFDRPEGSHLTQFLVLLSLIGTAIGNLAIQ